MLKNYQKGILLSIVIVVGAFGIASFAFYLSTYHPKHIESMQVISSGAEPVLVKGQKIKVLCWNVQFMAGKNIEVTNYYVRQHDTTLISDHFPLLIECLLP